MCPTAINSTWTLAGANLNPNCFCRAGEINTHRRMQVTGFRCDAAALLDEPEFFRRRAGCRSTPPNQEREKSPPECAAHGSPLPARLIKSSTVFVGCPGIEMPVAVTHARYGAAIKYSNS
jgi:hypothetical protein